MSEDLYYCFISIETGGLSHKENPIIHLSSIITNSAFKELERFSTFINPDPSMRLDEDALKVNGITLHDLCSGMSEFEMMKRLNSLFIKYNGLLPVFFKSSFAEPFLDALSLKLLFPLNTSGLAQDINKLFNFVKGSKKFRYNSICQDMGISLDPSQGLGISKCLTNIKLYSNLMKD
jgi:DNA polymerase III alpha subunit (gram-positive type)